jgi:FixJ family two-component response regulator
MGDASANKHLVVVVVDDDPDVLHSLQFALEVEGFAVEPFTNGEAALERAPFAGVSCLVLDYQLGGIDGLTLLGRLRERGCRLPAILITTPGAEVARRARLAGVHIIEKPLISDALVAEVRQLIEAPRV